MTHQVKILIDIKLLQAFQSQHMHQMMSPAAIQQQQQFLSSATLQQPFTNHQHAFSPYQQQHQHLSHHQPGFHMQQQMMFPAGTHCGMQSSFLSVPPQQLTGIDL